jgi:UDP-N-acetylmuramoyl-L-alanyl-D-glutamate--2,6-diaminopimelate ligase
MMTDLPRNLAAVRRSLEEAGVRTELRGSGDVPVLGVSQDSRTVREGDLFLAWRGVRHDAHDHLEDVLGSGAAAALVERFVDLPLPQVKVEDGRRAAALVAQMMAGSPSRSLRIAAVTGTNGKTTTVLLTRHLLGHQGSCAAIGTLGLTGPDGKVVPGTEGLTTPGPVRLATLFRELADHGVTMVTMEASSHALDQRRLDGVEFEVAVFTNFTQDHLDYHLNLESYHSAKARLITLLREGGTVVLNGSDPAWSSLPAFTGRLLVTSLEGATIHEAPPHDGERLPDLVATDVRFSGEGSRFRVRWGGEDAAVSLPLIGRFNLENALAAMAVSLVMGMSLVDIADVLSDVPAPTGRMELTVRDPVPVILDYAHTPDALERVLETLRPLYPGRLIVVFGAGGDRDRAKRPEMGRVAVQGADLAIVTSDNPRTEDPDAIVDEIVVGMTGKSYERITNRRDAIARAIQVARPGDAILLAGKGHETWQIVGTEKRPFDERQVVREILGGGRAA